MDMATRHFINDWAQYVINKYHISIPVENIDDVVKEMGGTIEERPYLDMMADGTIRKVGENSFNIVILSNQYPQRRTFTIAHELGHLFLHMGFKTNQEVWARQESTKYWRFGRSEQEYQANEFAASLLMPKMLFEEALMELGVNGRVDVSKLAERFNVSLSAAINRGKFLGFFP